MISSPRNLLTLISATLILGGAAFAAQPGATSAQIKKVPAKYDAAFVASLTAKVNKTHTELAAAARKKPAPTPKKSVQATTPKKTPAPLSPPVVQATPIKTSPLPPIEEQNQTIRKALVNILCTTQSGGSLKPISGSGIIVDPRGIILTNAHVAQFFLLKDYLVPNFVNCTIRTGSPAQEMYRAKLFYLPTAWVEQNAKNLTQEIALGSGEHDYALLAITETLSGAPLPSSFEYLKSNYGFNTVPLNHPVLLAGYPAELVGSVLTARDLHAITSASTISQAYYFENGNPFEIDLLSFAPTILAQSGSSGGAVVDRSDTSLLGLLVTTSPGSNTSEKTLNAVNLAHINRSLVRFTGKSFSEFLLGDLSTKIAQFEREQFPILYALMTKALETN